MSLDFFQKLSEIAGDAPHCKNEPMSRHTTFRVGGPAEYFVRPDTKQLPDILKLCRQCGIPSYIIGNGSNLLVGDSGMDGLVIEMGADEAEITIKDTVMAVPAGVLLTKAANAAAEAALGGMEFAAGIPGTVGGAVTMNAGAYGSEMKDIVSSVTVLDAFGTEKRIPAEEMAFGYRASCIPANHYIVVSADLKLYSSDREKILARMGELRKRRMEKQPLEFPSAGSTFKRPNGYYAGKLIMDAGLSGYRVGGAMVSEKHCGFVINADGATACEIRQLMADVIQKVEQAFHVTLEPEVKIIGKF